MQRQQKINFKIIFETKKQNNEKKKNKRRKNE